MMPNFTPLKDLRTQFRQCMVCARRNREDDGEDIVLVHERRSTIVCPFPPDWSRPAHTMIRMGLAVPWLIDFYRRPTDRNDPLWKMRHLLRMTSSTFAKMSKDRLAAIGTHQTTELERFAEHMIERVDFKLFLMPLDAAFVFFVIKDMHPLV